MVVEARLPLEVSVTRKKVRVVMADDHPMYRYGVAAVLATAEEIELVARRRTAMS